jgi:hypothetical protein
MFSELGLGTADLSALVEGKRAELMTALTDSGLQLGDRVKLRLWMDRQSPRVEARSPHQSEAPILHPMLEPASVWRSQVDLTSGTLQPDGALQGRGGTQDPATPGQLYGANRRAQETKEERT